MECDRDLNDQNTYNILFEIDCLQKCKLQKGGTRQSRNTSDRSLVNLVKKRRKIRKYMGDPCT